MPYVNRALLVTTLVAFCDLTYNHLPFFLGRHSQVNDGFFPNSFAFRPLHIGV
jgi:hypothetical protein